MKYDAQTIRNRLRLASGLVLFVFVTGHLINHALGLVSLDLMDKATAVFLKPWRTWAGTALLSAAIVVHIVIALLALWRRRSFKMKPWEAVQLGFGLAIPPLLAAHVAANLILPSISAYHGTYLEVIAQFAVYSPWRGIIMAFAVLIVWTHGCVGIHSWLRLKPWYARYQPLFFASAILVPALSLAGYLSASTRIQAIARSEAGLQIDYSHIEPWMPDFVYGGEFYVIVAMIGIVTVRAGMHLMATRSNRLRLTYAPGDRTVTLLPNATLLESIRAAGIPHASICGGRGRCSTCRVHVVDGLDHLPEPNEAEREVLDRVTASASVRLACQIRPRKSVNVIALVPHDAKPEAAHAKPGYQQGREMKIAVLFADLRDSTKLCEERLPFDVVFVLNQLFTELSKALAETNGHYAQFAGDGLMAIYGLDSDPNTGASEAIAGAVTMLRRLETLNERLKHELEHGLRIGVGIHTGEAIVGSMGPPAAPIISALGDNVNVAARLESQTKEFGVPLVVSAETAKLSGIDFSAFERRHVRVKGRTRPIAVYAVEKPETLAIPPDSTSPGLRRAGSHRQSLRWITTRRSAD